jgi:hypothetical protein
MPSAAARADDTSSLQISSMMTIATGPVSKKTFAARGFSLCDLLFHSLHLGEVSSCNTKNENGDAAGKYVKREEV